MKLLSLLFLLLTFTTFSLLSPSQAHAIAANMAVGPDPLPEGEDALIAINGDGYETFFFQIAEDSIIFSVNEGGCQTTTVSQAFSDFTCELTDEPSEGWEVSVTYTRHLPKGEHVARISAPNVDGWEASEIFWVGTDAPPPTSLTVTLDPAGPVVNDQEHTIKVSWSPAVDADYIVTTTIPGLDALPLADKCAPPSCSISFTLPAEAPAGVHTITVTQDRQGRNTGNAKLEITSSEVAKPATPGCTPQPEIKPLCSGDTITYSAMTCGDASIGFKCPDKSYELCRSDEGEQSSIMCDTGDPLPPAPQCKTRGDNNECNIVSTAIGDINTNPEGFVRVLFGVLLSIAGGIALILIIRSGYQMMTSQGEPEKLKEARERLTSVVVGLLFLVFSLVILEIIGVDILRLPGLVDYADTPNQNGSLQQSGSGTGSGLQGLPPADPANCGEEGEAPCSQPTQQNQNGCKSPFYTVTNGKCIQLGG